MKKILVMLLSVAIIATIAIGGSIAYLQDTDETVNTMVMGNVDIEQIEQERDAEGKLVAFRNAQKLYPATYNLVTSGTDSTPDGSPSVPGEKVPGGFYKNIVGAMDKIVSVKNVGKSDAYIRTWFAFEADNTTTDVNAGLKYIHINWNEDVKNDGIAVFQSHGINEIAGDKYAVFSVTYNNAFKKDETTPYSLLEVFMDKAATNEYVAQFGDTYEILVLSQGVQSMNFTSAAEAFTNAFGNQHPWTGRDTIAVPTIVKTEAELKAAINSIGSLRAGESINITLGANITLSENWSAPSFNKFEGSTNGNVTIVIDGNGYSINGLTVNSGNESAGLIGKIDGNVSFTARNLTFNDVKLTGNNFSGNQKNAAGALVGWLECSKKATIENVHVNGAQITGYKYMGGLIGYDSNSVAAKPIISNCSVNGATLNSTYTDAGETVLKGHTGGLVGAMNNATLDNNTVRDTTITGSSRSGALVGTAWGRAINGNNKCINVTVNNVEASANNLVGDASAIVPEAGITTTTDTTADLFIYTAAQLREFGTNATTGTYNGKTVVLMSDIDLNNAIWTPIGNATYSPINLNFDGKGHTIKNLKVSTADNSGASTSGLFGFTYSLKVKNLTVDGAEIAGSHNCGVIVGSVQDNGEIDNCHVKNATVTCTHESPGDCGNNAGAIVGYANTDAVIKNCTANTCTIKAARAAGQIVGTAKAANVTDCTATNVTVTADTSGCTDEDAGGYINNGTIGHTT